MVCHWVEKTLPDPLAGKLMVTGDPSGLKTQVQHPNCSAPFHRHLLHARPMLDTGVTDPVPGFTEHLGTWMSST